MAKTKVKRPLLLGMVIYALVFLVAAAVGLRIFWDFIGAFEASRPENTIEEYVSQMRVEDIAELAAPAMEQELQSADACRQVIMNALSGEITYARKTSESTDTKVVYALRCGSQVIGQVTLGTISTDQFGFSGWAVEQESYDFSYLMGEAVSVTVPREFTVAINGCVLSEAYITREDIPYEALEAFYGDYRLPTMVTYEAGPFLGSVELEVRNAQGEQLTLDEITDCAVFLDNVSEADEKRLSDFADRFLERYVAFTGSAHKSSENNYARLLPYVVLGSDLHVRMSMALDGLSWAQSNGDRLVSVTFNWFTDLGDGKYICDATYEVDTSGREGVVRTTNCVRFVIVEAAGGLRVEMLTTY